MPSYEKRANGWTVRFRETGNNEEVHKRLSGYQTKAEAEKAYKNYLNSYDHITPTHQINIVYFNDLWFCYQQNSKTRVRESSFYTIQSKVESHILPFFAERQVLEISPSDILLWQASLSGYSFKYRSVISKQLNSIFRFGNRYYDLPNPMLKVEPLRNLEAKKEMQIWSWEEFKQFVDVVDDNTYRCLFRFLYASGCRKGEALALSFDDIDLDKNTVRINKSLSRKVRDKPYAITPPKNLTSDRVIEMPHNLLEDMCALRKSKKDLFVFGGDMPLAENTLTRKYKHWVKLSGVKRIRIHDLRHSCASYLISKGNTIVAVSKRLGHADVTQTLNTYSHMMPSDNSKIIESISEI